MVSKHGFITVNGCLHGEFSTLLPLVSEETKLLILLGDLQLLSTKQDLSTCAIPYKYTYKGDIQKISDFHRILKNHPRDELAQKFNNIDCVLGIGGNHENMGLLEKLPFGGFVTENFFYMGQCNVIKYKGMKIAGFSGIYKQNDVYSKREYGFEQMVLGDYSWWKRNKVSSYHVRFFEILPLLLYDSEDEVDFVLSHDWPQNVFHNKDPNLENKLFKIKPFFKPDVQSGKLGSPLYDLVMKNLKPSNWFSAHLHIKYQTTIEFENGDSTDFMALDKLVPRRLNEGISQFELPSEVDEDQKFNDNDGTVNEECNLAKDNLLLEANSSNSNFGDCGIQLDEEFIKIQFWCFQNKHKIEGLIDINSFNFKEQVDQIQSLYNAEKKTIKLQAPLLKPFFSQNPFDYTEIYMKSNLKSNF